LRVVEATYFGGVFSLSAPERPESTFGQKLLTIS